ncbi:hypothetical protein KQ247_10175 [Ruegeria pomeroyi]|jgi:hypothetical protein|uniref:Uncharacterized protein n=1 Tax=Ruegeria pomeroyi TaxID=89184 RepID=A0A850LMW7_9RHOB|nr:hypothetical protein [Ruegeria pomeroyi]NVK99368.1 hypothetical protein [Ruegeria pomeroyi]NVL01266.1 hypothetical protein [Ruegeria pomeroyi]QWV07215.1 hypothetical protein KQ247_10175 [Ruegeria pomeroyi]
MNGDLGVWIVSGFALWIAIGFSGLFLIWWGLHNLGVYFTEMETTSWELRAALGWKLENPASPVLSVAGDYSHRRLYWRLALWGPPPQLEHTARAIEALRKYRRVVLISVVLQGLFVAGLGVVFSAAFYLVCLATIAFSLVVMRPKRWTEEPPK